MRARIVDEARIISCIYFPKLRNDALSQYAMTMRDIRLKVADALSAAVLQDPPPRPIYGEPMHADITSTCIPSQSSQDDASS